MVVDEDGIPSPVHDDMHTDQPESLEPDPATKEDLEDGQRRDVYKGVSVWVCRRRASTNEGTPSAFSRSHEAACS